jgi:hypothetical protein
MGKKPALKILSILKCEYEKRGRFANGKEQRESLELLE